jgi:hypothetical protein
MNTLGTLIDGVQVSAMFYIPPGAYGATIRGTLGTSIQCTDGVTGVSGSFPDGTPMCDYGVEIFGTVANYPTVGDSASGVRDFTIENLNIKQVNLAGIISHGTGYFGTFNNIRASSCPIAIQQSVTMWNPPLGIGQSGCYGSWGPMLYKDCYGVVCGTAFYLMGGINTCLGIASDGCDIGMIQNGGSVSVDGWNCEGTIEVLDAATSANVLYKNCYFAGMGSGSGTNANAYSKQLGYAGWLAARGGVLARVFSTGQSKLSLINCSFVSDPSAWQWFLNDGISPYSHFYFVNCLDLYDANKLSINKYYNYQSSVNYAAGAVVTDMDDRIGVFTNGGLDFRASSQPTAPSIVSTAIFSDFSSGSWVPYLTTEQATQDAQSYFVQHGTYVQIGGLCIAHFNLTVSAGAGSIGTLTGTYAMIAGLPYLSQNVAGVAQTGSISLWSGLGASYVSLGCYIDYNISKIQMCGQKAVGASNAPLLKEAWADSCQITGVIVYKIG